MADLTLVLTNREPSIAFENDGTYFIFHHTRLGFFGAESTGFKRLLRDKSNQVRHATGSIQVSARYGAIGLGFAQSEEQKGSADHRLNIACNAIASRVLSRDPGFEPEKLGDVLRRELGDPSEALPWTGPPDGLPDPP